MASAGILRIICTVESSAISAGFKSPVPSPSTKPMLPPIANPVSARHALTFTFAHMSPDWISSHAALTTASGSGNTRDDKPPVRAASSHAIRITTGTSHGAACTPARRKNGTTFIGPPGSTLRRTRQIRRADYFTKRPRQRTRRALFLFTRQQREYKLSKPVRLFKMRTTRQDEGVDTHRRVLFHYARDLLRITHQRRARTAAHESNTGPQ